MKMLLPTQDFFDFELYPASFSSNLEILGSNQKNILIIHQNTVEENDLEFLEKIFQALNLHPFQDCARISACLKPNFNLDLLQTHIFFHKLLVFGFSPSQIGLHLNIPKYQTQSWKGMTLIFSASLSIIQTDLKQKRMLWNSLKNTF